MPLSRSRIDRAGERIRSHVRASREPLDADLVIVEEFRELHLPTSLTVQEMLQRLRDEYTERMSELELPAKVAEGALPLTIASRPKTTESIIAKLCRSTTRLSLMQDIAGGRIIVPSLQIQNGILTGLITGFKSGGIEPEVKDTRERGDSLGYRGLHVVLRLGGQSAEIQLRTQWQQDWAQTVESLDQTLGTDLKHGHGPGEWLSWLKELSDALREAELGRTAPIPPRPDAE